MLDFDNFIREKMGFFQDTFHDKEYSIKRDEFALSINKNISIINNSASIANDLGLIKIIARARNYVMTQQGMQFINAVKKTDNHLIKALGDLIIIKTEKSPVLHFIYNYIKEHNVFSYEELGRKTAEHFDHVFNADKTYRHTAKCAVDVLVGFHLIDKNNINVLINKEKNLQKKTDKREIFSPRLSIKQIKQDVAAFQNDTSIELSNEHANTLLNLGLIENDYNNSYILSSMGAAFLNSKIEEQRKDVFQKILLECKPIKYIIENIKNITEITSEIIAESIESYNNRKYSEETKHNYGLKVYSWLKYGNIVVAKEKKDVLNQSVLDMKKDANAIFPLKVIGDKTIINDEIFIKLYYHYFEIKFNNSTSSKIEIIKLLEDIMGYYSHYKHMIEVAIDYFKNENMTHEQLDRGFKLIYQLKKLIDTKTE